MAHRAKVNISTWDPFRKRALQVGEEIEIPEKHLKAYAPYVTMYGPTVETATIGVEDYESYTKAEIIEKLDESGQPVDKKARKKELLEQLRRVGD